MNGLQLTLAVLGTFADVECFTHLHGGNNAGWSRLTYSQGFVCVPHGGPDDVGSMDAVLVAKLLGLIEPFSCQVPQLALVLHSLL